MVIFIVSDCDRLVMQTIEASLSSLEERFCVPLFEKFTEDLKEFCKKLTEPAYKKYLAFRQNEKHGFFCSTTLGP